MRFQIPSLNAKIRTEQHKRPNFLHIMSMTISAGMVSAGHVSYMAKTLADSIGAILKNKKIEEKSIPPSLYADAHELFDLLRDFLGGTPRNPPASANAFVLVSDVLQKIGPARTHAATHKLIAEFVDFFYDIQREHVLSKDEARVATLLQSLLYQLYIDGNSENYVSRMGATVPLPIFRSTTFHL